MCGDRQVREYRTLRSKEVSLIGIDVIQKALVKARENGWPALKRQTIHYCKDGAAIMIEF
jgi:hypothetical protein